VTWGSSSELFWYDGDGKRVATIDSSGVLTDYFAGGSYEVTGASVKKYYALGGVSMLHEGGAFTSITQHNWCSGCKIMSVNNYELWRFLCSISFLQT
jgi:hypothetical protein